MAGRRPEDHGSLPIGVDIETDRIAVDEPVIARASQSLSHAEQAARPRDHRDDPRAGRLSLSCSTIVDVPSARRLGSSTRPAEGFLLFTNYTVLAAAICSIRRPVWARYTMFRVRGIFGEAMAARMLEGVTEGGELLRAVRVELLKKRRQETAGSRWSWTKDATPDPPALLDFARLRVPASPSRLDSATYASATCRREQAGR